MKTIRDKHHTMPHENKIDLSVFLGGVLLIVRFKVLSYFSLECAPAYLKFQLKRWAFMGRKRLIKVGRGGGAFYAFHKNEL